MLKKIILTFSTLSLLLVPMLAPVYAAEEGGGTKDIVCKQLNQTGEVKCDNAADPLEKTINNVINILTFVIGTAAVIIIIIAGLMYVLSGGNPQNTARAKDAIIYAVVGLIVAILARLIVNFVISNIG